MRQVPRREMTWNVTSIVKACKCTRQCNGVSHKVICYEEASLAISACISLTLSCNPEPTPSGRCGLSLKRRSFTDSRPLQAQWLVSMEPSRQILLAQIASCGKDAFENPAARLHVYPKMEPQNRVAARVPTCVQSS